MIATIAALLMFTSPGPLEPPLTQRPDVQAGLVCWWACMAGCLLLGNTHQQCEMACDDLCYRMTAPPPDGPTCEPPDEGPVACVEG